MVENNTFVKYTKVYDFPFLYTLYIYYNETFHLYIKLLDVFLVNLSTPFDIPILN